MHFRTARMIEQHKAQAAQALYEKFIYIVKIRIEKKKIYWVLNVQHVFV